MTPEPSAAPEAAREDERSLDRGADEPVTTEPRLRIWDPRTGEVDGPEAPADRAKRDLKAAANGRSGTTTSRTDVTRPQGGIVVTDGEVGEVAGPVAIEPAAGPVRDPRARRARRVVRVVRRIELWSVLKVALVVLTCLYLAALGAVVLLWAGAHSTGLVDDLESFLGDVGFEDFAFKGDVMFRRVAAIGGILVLTGSVLAVLFTSLVNLVSELTGGIRVVIIEEEPIEDAEPSR